MARRAVPEPVLPAGLADPAEQHIRVPESGLVAQRRELAEPGRLFPPEPGARRLAAALHRERYRRQRGTGVGADGRYTLPRRRAARGDPLRGLGRRRRRTDARLHGRPTSSTTTAQAGRRSTRRATRTPPRSSRTGTATTARTGSASHSTRSGSPQSEPQAARCAPASGTRTHGGTWAATGTRFWIRRSASTGTSSPTGSSTTGNSRSKSSSGTSRRRSSRGRSP